MEQKQKHNTKPEAGQTVLPMQLPDTGCGLAHINCFSRMLKKTKQKKTLHECIRSRNNTRRSQTMHVSLPLRRIFCTCQKQCHKTKTTIRLHMPFIACRPTASIFCILDLTWMIFSNMFCCILCLCQDT